MRRAVLVTRPEPGLSETMRAVAALGFEPMAAPMLRIEPLSPTIPKRVQAVLLTSGQAVAPVVAAAPWLLVTPVLAVGDATAERARAAGFERVTSADGDAGRLAALAAERLQPGGAPLLLACGSRQGASLCRTLREAGFAVDRRCVYRSVPRRRLAPEALDALRQERVRAVLFFSAETARSFLGAVPPGLAARLQSVTALAIGALAADVLSGAGWRDVLVARQPNAAALLSLLAAGAAGAAAT